MDYDGGISSIASREAKGENKGLNPSVRADLDFSMCEIDELLRMNDCHGSQRREITDAGLMPFERLSTQSVGRPILDPSLPTAPQVWDELSSNHFGSIRVMN
jgi:hypothetical protein